MSLWFMVLPLSAADQGTRLPPCPTDTGRQLPGTYWGISRLPPTPTHCRWLLSARHYSRNRDPAASLTGKWAPGPHASVGAGQQKDGVRILRIAKRDETTEVDSDSGASAVPTPERREVV